MREWPVLCECTKLNFANTLRCCRRDGSAMPQASDSSRPVTVTVASVVVFLLLRDYHRLFTFLVLNQGVPKGRIGPGCTMIRVATIEAASSVFVQVPVFGHYDPT